MAFWTCATVQAICFATEHPVFEVLLFLDVLVLDGLLPVDVCVRPRGAEELLCEGGLQRVFAVVAALDIGDASPLLADVGRGQCEDPHALGRHALLFGLGVRWTGVETWRPARRCGRGCRLRQPASQGQLHLGGGRSSGRSSNRYGELDSGRKLLTWLEAEWATEQHI